MQCILVDLAFVIWTFFETNYVYGNIFIMLKSQQW